jgi:hypothetical protein
MKAVLPDGTPIPLISSNNAEGKVKGWTNFMLQSVQESRVEKQQMIETFGDTYVWFFGESPRFLDVQAIVLNSNDFNWEAEFWANYERYFRGTKLTELGARLYLCYDDTIVEGYMMNAQAQKTAQQPLEVPIAFRLFVTGSTNVSNVGSGAFPIRASVQGLWPMEKLRKPLSPDDIKKLVKLNGSHIPSDVDIGDFVNNAEALVDRPLRSNIEDNADEWTDPDPSPFIEKSDFQDDIDDLLVALNKGMQDLGALTSQLQSLMDPQSAYGSVFNKSPLNTLPSLSPKEQWNKLKKTYSDAKNTTEKISKTGSKVVNAVTHSGQEWHDFWNDPDAYVADKVKKSGLYDKVVKEAKKQAENVWEGKPMTLNSTVGSPPRTGPPASLAPYGIGSPGTTGGVANNNSTGGYSYGYSYSGGTGSGDSPSYSKSIFWSSTGAKAPL